MSKNKDQIRKYVDGGDMKLSKNLLESRKALDAEKASGTKKLRRTTKTKSKAFKKMSSSFDEQIADKEQKLIYFNTKMRKTFVEGVLQDIKGYFENEAKDAIWIVYQDHNLKDHEFGFKMTVKKINGCSKSLWSDVSNAILSTVNYMFSSFDENHLDITISSFTSRTLEFQIVSCW